jgi:Ca2+-transporting ATPase
MNGPWSAEKEQLLQKIESNPVSGLTQAEAETRLKQDGLNKLTEPVKITFWGTFWDEVREPMIILLLVVGVLYSVWGLDGCGHYFHRYFPPGHDRSVH